MEQTNLNSIGATVDAIYLCVFSGHQYTNCHLTATNNQNNFYKIQIKCPTLMERLMTTPRVETQGS